ncbi:Hsp20/alpha crystallin family protein [Achromobacter aloeverae]|uniref:Heat-shock protein n=1 Tax=Achromobacter aloeverae TaxID=1750518 RepID=A0A4Q1HDG5_9BURK|nr:Hsp20/alpha crystallin family protein [Achromobacter aloeverae]RXN83199.1 heat-shock protein [Achromobacter aloeverae]
MTVAVSQPADTRETAVRAAGSSAARPLLPRVDVTEDELGLTLLADLPGVPRDKLDIQVDGTTLKIEGVVVPFSTSATHAEVTADRYLRAFTLSPELDGAGIVAELANGLLKLRIPKREKPQPRRIDISLS